jgi:hypothetical protein
LDPLLWPLLRLLRGLAPTLLRLAPLSLSALFLLALRLPLRALLLGGWRCTLPPTLVLFRLILFFRRAVGLRVHSDSRPKKQKHRGGTGSSNELHSNRLH